MQLDKQHSEVSSIDTRDNGHDVWAEYRIAQYDPRSAQTPGSYYRDSNQYGRGQGDSNEPYSSPYYRDYYRGPQKEQEHPKEREQQNENAPQGGAWEPREKKQSPQWDKNPIPPVVKKQSLEDQQFIGVFREQVELRENRPSTASYLGAVSNMLYRGDNKELAKLKTMLETLEQNKQNNKVLTDKDRTDLGKQLRLLMDKETQQAQVGQSTAAVLKMAPLFVPGTTGWVLTAGVNALDAASPSSSLGRQAVDLTLGTTKGLALRGALTLAPELTSNLALQGVGLGITSRVLEAGLSSGSYIDPTTKQFDLSTGLRTVVSNTFNPYALAGDAVTLGIASVGIKNINGLTGGIIENSQAAKVLTIGGVYGMANGFSREAIRQYQANEFSYYRLAQSGMQGFGLGVIAAAPGALAVHMQQPTSYPPNTWGRQSAGDGFVNASGKYPPSWRQGGELKSALKLPGNKIAELPHKSY